MASRTLEGFTRRAWLAVWAVIAYLVMLQGLHAFALWQEHARLAAETEARTRLAAAAIAQHDRAAIMAALDDFTRRGGPRRLTVPRSFTLAHGITSVRLLTPAGFGVSESRPQPGEGPSSHLSPADRRRLAAGETIIDLGSARADPVYAVASAYLPVLDPAARLLGIVHVEVGAERLARSRAQMVSGLLIQGATLVLFAVLLAFLFRWVLRPLGLLARTAGLDDAASAADLASRDETGFVVARYARMIEQLQEKEHELRRLREVERHRADALQELNASIVDSMVSGVLVLDLSGSVRTCNAVLRDILGIRDERVTGRPYLEVLRHVPELHARIQACLEDGAVFARDEVRLSLAGAGRRDVGISLSPLRDAEGARTGALCLLSDLTEVKRLQEEVRLKQNLAELGELSAGVAHEFRNSLAAIGGFARLIEKKAAPDAAAHAAAIGAECTALRRVVDDFLRFANPTRLVIDAVDLARLLEELGEDVRARAREDVRERPDGKQVTYEVAPGLPTVSGDDTLLRRAFGNLLRNAADAVADGGTVRVTWEEAPREIVVHVDDDGPGIPADARERIFVPFFTRKEKGTGLGLALARKVVVHHGGRISVGDSPLGGARLTVTLPLRKAP